MCRFSLIANRCRSHCGNDFILGSLGAYKEIRCMILKFFVILFLIFFLMLILRHIRISFQKSVRRTHAQRNDINICSLAQWQMRGILFRKILNVAIFLLFWIECNQKFKDSDSYKSHQMKHLGIRPYRCDWPGCECEGKSHKLFHIYFN